MKGLTMAERMRIQGAMAALVTPFRNGQVDWPALGRLIEFQIAGGIQGLVPCGTTGESPTLSHGEHDKVVGFVVEQSAGRAPVIAGTGSNSTAEAVRLTKHARSAGADACLIVNPYYNKPTQHGMYAHVAQVAEVGLPIVLYNHPGRTGVELTPETIVKMYDQAELVVGVKDATGNLDSASAVAAACDIDIVSGNDSLTLPICSVGGTGVISVLANILPGEVRKLADAITAGNMAAATAQHRKLFALFKMMDAEINPIPIKAALAMAGMITEELRLPLTPLRDRHRIALTEMLDAAGVKVRT